MSLLQHSLPYQDDSALLFERIAHEPWAMMLDSGQALNAATRQPGSQYGRYDILVARPILTLVTNDQVTKITENNASTTVEDDPFSSLNQVLSRYNGSQAGIPFAGGAVGYFAYDLGRRLEAIEDKNTPESIPEMMVGIYDWAIVIDHRDKKTTLMSHGLSEQTTQNWQMLCRFFEEPSKIQKASFTVTSETVCNFSAKSYQQAFNKIKQYIQSGDCYQVNLAQRFSANVMGDSWTAYKKLREISPAPFMAYMNLPDADNGCFQVLSNSPERFVQVIGKHVETRPIKGTRPRSKDKEQDQAYAKALQNSSKDHAENVMIVDLLRNDIGKTCEIGSVKVAKLFQLQSFANVHHLVSIVKAKLKQNETVIDLLKGCFPGGSITGAPKVRSMQIIEELEPNRRGVYCGAIGYISFDGNMDTNIAIRTAVINNEKFSYYAGGGIVSDSMGEKEYLEALDKASIMIKLLAFFKRRD